jgi:phage terminase Nu1 subunit (DNA packaging protein)
MNETQLLAGYITRADLAAQLGITERTIQNYERLPDGLPFMTMGGKIKLYRIESVAAWIAAREKSRNPRRRAA